LGGSGSGLSVSNSGSGEGSPGEDSPEKVSQEWFTMEIPILRAYTSLQLRLRLRALQLSGSGLRALHPALHPKASSMALPRRLTANSILTTKSPYTTRNHPNTTTEKLPY